MKLRPEHVTGKATRKVTLEIAAWNCDPKRNVKLWPEQRSEIGTRKTTWSCDQKKNFESDEFDPCEQVFDTYYILEAPEKIFMDDISMAHP